MRPKKLPKTIRIGGLMAELQQHSRQLRVYVRPDDGKDYAITDIYTSTDANGENGRIVIEIDGGGKWEPADNGG